MSCYRMYLSIERFKYRKGLQWERLTRILNDYVMSETSY